MEIQKVTTETASTASQIHGLSWKIAYKNIVPQKYLDEILLERWTPFLLNPQVQSFVLQDEGEFVAAGSIAPAREESQKGWGEIISIYVLPNHFQKGYGKKLFSYLVETLQQMGFYDICLWVLEENLQARKFYEANGFAPNGCEKIVSIGGKELVEIQYTNIKS